MTLHTSLRPSRRAILTGGAGLVVGAFLPKLARAQVVEDGEAAIIDGPAEGGAFAPNAFIRIAEDDTVTVLVKHIEFGQGPYTGLATLVAEELDADWSQMRAEAAPADAALYANAAFGIQGTGGSTAMATSYIPMRQAGAAARAMLIAAAAKAWEVPAGEITIANGVLAHAGSGRTSGFGAFATAAAAEEAPAEPVLKDPSAFTLIGTDRPKLDTAAKTTGEAMFTLDVYREDMLTTAVLHPPMFGARLASVDTAAALAVPGVVDVKEIPQGVAVYAENTFAAFAGRDALTAEWDDSAAETRSSVQIETAIREAAQTTGALAYERGDIEAGLAEATQTLEAEFVFPYLAHAPMEPLDAVIERRGDTIEAWLGSQLQTVDQNVIAQVCGVEPSNVLINTMLAGGSFGRRAQGASDFAAEAAAALMAHGGERPIKLVWSREDDIRGGFYRPLTLHTMRGGVNEAGEITAWDQVIAGQSIIAGTPFEGAIQNGVDGSMVEGARDLPYSAPNVRVSAHIVPAGVPVLWWRAVGHTHTAMAVECFIDELLEAGGRDAVEGRLALLGDHPREAAALQRAAEMADWGRAAPEGRAYGVAMHKSFGSYVAQIAEVSLGDGPVPRVHHVWCAIDCGVAVNPNVIKAQMEGGIGFGLSAAYYSEIVLDEGGHVRESNFHDYPSLRINEMPTVDVGIIASSEAPTGVGEPGTPPITPALANAMRRLTGEPVRRLPLAPPYGA